MSLQVWLPFNGDLHNQGLLQLPTPTASTFEFVTGGKISAQSTSGAGRLAWHLTEDFLNNAWSVATWIKPTATFGSYNNIIFCKNTSSSTDCQIYFSIVNGASLHLGVNGSSSSLSINYTFTVGTWYHVAATYDGNLAALYINGEQKVTKVVTTAWPGEKLNMQLNDRSNNVAGTGSGGSAAAKYAYNDFRIYDHCLSAKEVEEISKGLVLHYKLDQPNNNILTQEILHTAPFVSATTFVGDYEGYNDVLSVRNNTLYQKTSSGKNDIFTGITWDGNVQYTLSGIWRDDRTDGKNSSMQFRFHYTDNTTTTIKSPQSKWGQWIPFKLTSTAGKSVDKITTTYGNAGDIYIANFKLEIGPDQTLFLGFIPNNIIYDSSGYNNDGTIIGSLEATISSSRYSCATKFSNSSVIKVIENNWLSQGMKEMTINLWAKASTWPTTGRLFSCTETGGFNLEAGSSGYWRFSVHVYTNSAQSSTAYKYDNQEIQISALPVNEWAMITLIYDGTGTRSYINGELHHTYFNVSYGIHFNTNARLFLGCEASTANPSSPYFTGEMSDFRIYNTVLTAEQIKELYNTSMTIDNNGNIHARELVE